MKIILNRKLILILLAILLFGILIYGLFFNKKGNGFKSERVIRGTITQEVSETGTVEPTQEIKLGFKTAGRIEKINIKVGDIVAKGALLVEIETSQLYIQLDQAKASLVVAQTQYSKLSVDDKNAAQQDLNDTYQDAMNAIDDAYLKIHNAYSVVNSLQNSYFGVYDQEGIKIQDNKNIIGEALNSTKASLDTAKNNQTNDNIDSAISKIIFNLNTISSDLKIIRDICDQGVYYSKVSSADKTAIDNQRSYIITALTNISNNQQTISSDKIALQKAENEIDYYQAKVAEAQADVNYYQQQIWETTLRAPIAGTITKVDKKAGETVQATDLLISLISSDPLQVKVDIYEEDIVKIQKDNPVDIKITAFPNETLRGRVVAIDPAEKIIEGVVYYEITIAFDELKEGIKPGMTADVVIKTAAKENVLTISKEAIRENGKITVLVFKNGKEEEKEIQIGLEGNDGRIEVVFGLSEGEEVIIK